MGNCTRSTKKFFSNLLSIIRSRTSMADHASDNISQPTPNSSAPPQPPHDDMQADVITPAAATASEPVHLRAGEPASLDQLFRAQREFIESHTPVPQPVPPSVDANPSTLQLTTTEKKELTTISDYIAAEVSLETIGYFIPSSKRIKDMDAKEEVVGEIINADGTKAEVKANFIYSRKYGIPNTTDQDYYRAFLKILDETVELLGFIPEPLELSTDLMIRYAGKQWRGGKRNSTLQELRDFIQVNRYTGIQGYLHNAKTGRFAEVGEEPLFRKYVLRGETLESGDIAQTNYVWLASWFRTNYEHHYVRTVDHAFHLRLRKPIAKALYPLLATGWYASKGQPYEKSYHDLCQKYLLREYHHESLIRKQLDPSLQELQGYTKPRGSKTLTKMEGQEFLADWSYRRAADGKDWIIIFYPGDKHFKDQKVMRERQQLAKGIPSRAVTPASGKISLSRSSTVNTSSEVDYFVGEIAKVLHLSFSRGANGPTAQKERALVKKWLRHYPYYGMIDLALSTYKHDTEDLPPDKKVRTELAYFQAILHKTAHRKGIEWIRPCSPTCKYRV
jgi:hypothetical protein